MAFTEKAPPPPPPQVPFTDKNGNITPEWHRWILLLVEYLNRMGAAIP